MQCVLIFLHSNGNRERIIMLASPPAPARARAHVVSSGPGLFLPLLYQNK